MEDKSPNWSLQIGTVTIDALAKTHIKDPTVSEAFGETALLTFAVAESEAFLIDPAVFREGSDVAFFGGYGDDQKLLFVGELTRIKPMFSSASECVVAIECSDFSNHMKRQPPNRTFTNVRFKGVIETFARFHNLDLVVIPERPLVDNPAGLAQAVEQEDQTDWEVIGEIAKRMDYKYFVRERTLYMVRDSAFSAVDGTRFEFVFNPVGDELGAGVYPLIDFFPERGTDDQRSKVEVISWSSVGADGKRQAAATLADLPFTGESYSQVRVKTEAIETLTIRNKAVSSTAEARDIAIAELRARAANFISGQGVVVGDPRIRIGQTHKMTLKALNYPESRNSFGRQFTGYYLLTGVKHSFSSEGFITSFDVQRGEVTKFI